MSDFDRPFYTIPEAAEKLRVHENTLYNMVRRGEIEHYKVTLDRSRVKYQIDDQSEQEDGSIVLHIRKQYNDRTDVSEYFK